jgi:hypothetical protein
LDLARGESPSADTGTGMDRNAADRGGTFMAMVLAMGAAAGVTVRADVGVAPVVGDVCSDPAICAWCCWP